MFMPESDRDISIVGGSGGGDGDDDDQVEGSIDGTHRRVGEDVDDQGNRKQRADFTKVTKLVVLFPFTKAKKQFNLRRKRKRFNRRPSSSAFAASANAISSFSSGNKRVGVRIGRKACCFCIKKPQTLESPPVESRTSDPNDPNFTLDMLKNLMQKNDFYSEECNPHSR